MRKLAVVLGIGAAAAITRVGLATTGEVHGVIALELGQVWTGEGSFSFWNKLAFDTLYQSEDELIGLFQLPPARTRLLKNNKSYHFSGPQQLGMPVKCPERQKCIATASWETGTNWTIGIHPYITTKTESNLTTPAVVHAPNFIYFVDFVGPASVTFYFNMIHWKFLTTFQLVSYRNRYERSVITQLTQAIPSTLNPTRPNGIIGLAIHT
ncbi:hypothetical protein DSO57_1007899 [Entomophthora muscae]|uniref:Uncharacterized protein n=1 Tax=Entomophthora muscae TaxID=34485 RepID=A0ACC2T743_9FUNG|nr:hypothetical protein DSO57_1007899 [Entomophthora muscae]